MAEKNVRLYTIEHCLTHWLLWPLFAYLDFVLLVFLCNSIKLGKCWHTHTNIPTESMDVRSGVWRRLAFSIIWNYIVEFNCANEISNAV